MSRSYRQSRGPPTARIWGAQIGHLRRQIDDLPWIRMILSSHVLQAFSEGPSPTAAPRPLG